MTCFTTRHIQRGGGVRATFFNSEGAKINDSLGPPGIGPPGYAPGGGELVRYNLGRAVPLRKWTHFYTKLNQTFDPLLYQKSHFSAKLIIILKTFSKIPVIFEKLDSKLMTFWPVS